MSDRRHELRFLFIASDPALDFVNTRRAQRGHDVDLLASLSDLVAWLTESSLLPVAHANAALQRWKGTPDGDMILSRALSFRESLRDIVQRISLGQPAQATDIEPINALLREYSVSLQLFSLPNGGFRKSLPLQVNHPLHLLFPLANAAADLLSLRNPRYMRRCESPRCNSFFYDTSKNHARRWCSMEICGNRAKVAAHHRRHQGHSAQKTSQGAASTPLT